MSYFDVMYSNFLLMYKAWQNSIGSLQLEAERRRAFLDAAARLAETGIELQNSLQDNAAKTPKEGRTVTAVL